MANAADGTECEQLNQLKLTDTRITRAETIAPAPKWQVPDSLFTRLAGNIPFTVNVPFCRVTAVIEKEINVEVWLPKDWNQRFAHCFGGTGPSVFDAMTPLVAWVERGEAPREIVATQPALNGSVVRTRPLCPHPQMARYKGTGRVEDAASFECR